MRYNNILIGIMFIAIAMFAISMVSAATITVTTPASSAVISGTSALKATSSGISDGNWSCIFYAKSASTANSTWTAITTALSNNTAGIGTNTTINSSFASAGLEDSNNYYFNATCYNDTNVWSAPATSSIQVNNTVPTAPSSTTPVTATQVTTTTTQTFSGTVTNRETTGCNYVIARGGATSGADYLSGTGTYSESTCSFTKTFSSSVDNGIWFWYLTASDESDTTPSAVKQLQVSFVGSGNDASLADSYTSGTETSNPLSNLSNQQKLILLLAIGLIAWLIVKKN